jgi:hypothetical protein
MRRRQRWGGKLGVQVQGLPLHPVVTGEGKAGRVNIREPSVMLR